MPEAFTNKLRLAIISALVTGEKNFKELQRLTDATSGNLGAQLAKLEEWEYINCRKEFISRKPQSTYQLTEKGLSEFKGYVMLLEKILKGTSE
jgi:Predicted transcriptional regulators